MPTTNPTHPCKLLFINWVFLNTSPFSASNSTCCSPTSFILLHTLSPLIIPLTSILPTLACSLSITDTRSLHQNCLYTRSDPPKSNHLSSLLSRQQLHKCSKPLTFHFFFHFYPHHSGLYLLTLFHTFPQLLQQKSHSLLCLCLLTNPDFTLWTFSNYSSPFLLTLVSLRARTCRFFSPNILPIFPFFSSWLHPCSFRHPSLYLRGN